MLIQGDLVGGDKYMISFGRSETPARMRRLSPLLLEAARVAFVPPRDMGKLLADFKARSTSLLQAPAGHGRTTLAIRLLLEAAQDTIYVLDPAVDLAQLADAIEVEQRQPDDRLRGAGLVVEPEAATPVSGRQLRNLDHLLMEAKARLVIIVGPDTRLADEEALDHRLPAFDPPTHRAIVESHLRWRLGYRAEQVLDQDGMGPAIDDLVPQLPRRRAATFAELVQRATEDGKTNITLVRDRMARRNADDFTIWLDGFTDREDICFAVALAVLDGMPHQTVTEAGRVLLSELDTTRNKPTDLSRAGAGDRLDEFRACQREVYARDSFGRTVVHAVEYSERTYPRRVIQHFWGRSGFTEAITAWLLELASAKEQPERVRIRAATALGLLAIQNFDYLHHRMFAPWARDDDNLRREAVANALRVPTTTASTEANVMRLVEEWHGGVRGSTQTQATAARAYGVSLASSNPTWLIDRLGRLAVIDKHEVRTSVGRSLSDLAGRDDCRLAGPIMMTLCDWLPNYRREPAAQWAFLEAALSLIAEMGDDDRGAPKLWPVLLVLADRDQGLRVRLRLLWADALESWTFGDAAAAALTDWAVMAEKNQTMRRAFTYLIGAIHQQSERMQHIVRHLVEQWHSPDHLQPLTTTATAVKGYLDQLETNTTNLEQT
ncbi:hypothetical protein [Plantactinospora sp. KBS50]|uniref:hypothetical protein n=1 Tax=Plantactinospora sp. KBS50 TaxID=2024580 RepID=UPI000BAB1F6F|nr:hypothetical protein [Plantactinospora sp. KBS50]ASW54241.1 hypothetical protein CIK06_08615 [Plantactinospora sp. KBS50]